MKMFPMKAAYRRSRGLLTGTALLALAAAFAQPAAADDHSSAPGRGPMAGRMHAGGDRGGPGGTDRMGGMGSMGDMGGMGGMGGPGLGMSHGRQGERLLDSVGATAEQKTQLRQIMDGARNDVKPLRDAARELHRQMMALLAQPTVDARAAEALRQQLQANREQVSKRMMQAMLDASRVLSPEQRKQIAERMEQRRSLMQRHRAERDALEGAPRRP
jgi:Spy/CpxP family protein refolding chaperone